jgi:hypothetical protein
VNEELGETVEGAVQRCACFGDWQARSAAVGGAGRALCCGGSGEFEVVVGGGVRGEGIGAAAVFGKVGIVLVLAGVLLKLCGQSFALSQMASRLSDDFSPSQCP